MAGARAIDWLPLRAWLEAPPRLRRGEVHVILARLPPLQSPHGAPAVLDGEERQRKRRLAFAEDRHRFAWSHAVLRAVLGRYLGKPPAAVRFARRSDPHARPSLTAGARLRLDFSLSHAGGFAAVAVMRGARVGVDVETPRLRLDPIAIARAHFAPSEVAALEACPRASQAATFLRLWTAKEAALKALGTGLWSSLSEIAFRLDRDGRPKFRAQSALTLIMPAQIGGATLALAAPRKVGRVRFWSGSAFAVARRR